MYYYYYAWGKIKQWHAEVKVFANKMEVTSEGASFFFNTIFFRHY